RETDQVQWPRHCVSAAGYHHIGIAALDDSVSLADGLTTRRASGQTIRDRSHRPIPYCDERRGHVAVLQERLNCVLFAHCMLYEFSEIDIRIAVTTQTRYLSKPREIGRAFAGSQVNTCINPVLAF